MKACSHPVRPVSVRWRALVVGCAIVGHALASTAVAAGDGAGDSRIAWGRARVSQALTDAGYTHNAIQIEIHIDPDSPQLPTDVRRAEGFAVKASAGRVEIVGFDGAGVLYGCLTAAERIRHAGEVPVGWSDSDAPKLELRAPCVLLMKLGDYNFPVTPEEFPFFYDRALWTRWLDRMAELRFNALTLWNGHPFAYFVNFDRYPEAQAGMPAGLVERNRELLHWLVAEAGRRNIRLLFEFYNIHTSVYFQQAHHLPGENRVPTPLLRDYTAYAVETFAREFPEVGYYITPGEAIEAEYTDGWVNDVLLPAIRRGGARGPIWLRSWGIDLPRAKKVADANPDVWMERKFNVEMIADTRPDPANREWAALDGHFVVNIHMAANLEPFRWCPPEYIRQCVLNSYAGGARGLQLYPRKAWRWPNGSEPGLPLVQWERDWAWYSAWARYSWNPDREPAKERTWWLGRLTEHFGSAETAANLLRSQEVAADVLPALQRLLWLGDSNHTVVAAGARLSELEKAPGIPFLQMSDVVQRMPEYLADLRAGREPPHPTPADTMDTQLEAATAAVALARSAAGHALLHRAEAAAWARDAAAIEQVAHFYREKLDAAILRAGAAAPNSGIAADAFLEPLARSVETYRSLAQSLAPAYDSLSDVPAWNPARLKKVPYHWLDLVPLFDRELSILRGTFSSSAPVSREPDLPGLTGLLYGDAGLNRVVAADPLATLEQDWKNAGRGHAWSAEWHGFIVCPRDGGITLRVRSDQAVSLEARGERVLDGKASGRRDVTIVARRGEAVPVRLTYDHPDGNQPFLDVQWNAGAAGFAPLPPTALLHSQEDERWASTAVIMSEL